MKDKTRKSMKTHYAEVERANESDPQDYWSKAACGLEYYESVTNNIKYVDCKNCIKRLKKINNKPSKMKASEEQKNENQQAFAIHNVSSCTEIEAPYFDKNGKQIKEFAVIKIFHFKGVNEQGKGRKNYYMYKWVRLTEKNGKKWWTALHLTNDSGDYFHLRSTANSEKVLTDTEIVQQY